MVDWNIRYTSKGRGKVRRHWQSPCHVQIRPWLIKLDAYDSFVVSLYLVERNVSRSTAGRIFQYLSFYKEETTVTSFKYPGNCTARHSCKHIKHPAPLLKVRALTYQWPDLGEEDRRHQNLHLGIQPYLAPIAEMPE